MILNPKFQKVDIATSGKNIKIEEEKAKTRKGKYLVERDGYPTQITIEKEGYLDNNYVMSQYKKSPYYIISWIPFGILLLLPPYYDQGKRAWDYDNYLKDDQKYYKEIPVKTEEDKDIFVNKVSLELEKEDFRYRRFRDYRQFKNKIESKETSIVESDEEINIEKTIFTDALNDILKEKGYVDTTRKVLKNSYSNNLFIEAKINRYVSHYISHSKYWLNGGFNYADLTIEWTVLNFYKEPIFTKETTITSGQFTSNDDMGGRELSIRDGIKKGLSEFLNDSDAQKLLKDKSQSELEKNYKPYTIPSSKKYVSKLSESVKAGVTIKTKDGHGSGFIISENGYIITNYHVVSDTSDLEVVLNNNKKYPVEIIRVSKISDLALLKIDAKGLMAYKVSPSKEIEIASEIYAVGTPSAEDLSQTISKGIISATRTMGPSKLIQTDASINGGNSGGAIINKSGLVLGVVSSKLKGFGIEGVAFGIPSYEIYDALKLDFK